MAKDKRLGYQGKLYPYSVRLEPEKVSALAAKGFNLSEFVRNKIDQEISNKGDLKMTKNEIHSIAEDNEKVAKTAEKIFVPIVVKRFEALIGDGKTSVEITRSIAKICILMSSAFHTEAAEQKLEVLERLTKEAACGTESR